MSENGFKWKEGFAVMPRERTAADMEGTELSRWVKLTDKERQELQDEIKYPVEEIEVTQQMRQDMFDNQETTDDHGMEIIGWATDQGASATTRCATHGIRTRSTTASSTFPSPTSWPRLSRWS